MIQYFLQVCFAMAVLYLPFALWFRNETFFKFNRSYLLAALAVSFIAPLMPMWVTFESNAALSTILDPVIIGGGYELPMIESVGNGGNAGPGYSVIIARVYMAVVILLLTRICIGIAGILRLRYSGQVYRVEGQMVIVSDQIRTPFSFFKWVFIPTETFVDGDAFGPILRHEAMHVRLGHSIDTLLAEIICSIMWINPFSYLYKGALKAVHEYQADNIVGEEDLIKYTQLLISQSQSGLRLALTNQFFQSQLKSRIMMMMKQRSSDNRKWRYLALLPLLAAMTLLYAFKAPQPAAQDITIGTSIGDPDKMPGFPGCEAGDKNCTFKGLVGFMTEHVKYPEAARKAGVEGTVILSLTVNSNGKLENVGVVRGLDKACDDEAVRVVRSMNDLLDPWTPGVKDGKPVSVEMKLPVSFALPKKEGGDGMVDVDQMPRFPGCETVSNIKEREVCAQNKMLEYLFSNIKYPKDAKEKNIEGRVVAQFIVEPNGLISTIQVVSGAFPSIDAETVRVLESMNQLDAKWTPAFKDGKPVAYKYTLPVMFKLPKESSGSNE